MKTMMHACSTILFTLVLFIFTRGTAMADAGGEPVKVKKPGDAERAALAKVGFLVGEWEGEGWFLADSGERTKFWVYESYRYRGEKDLLDMEGRFGGLGPDGSKLAEESYALGILYFDRASGEYRMWHYSSDGGLFVVKMDIDSVGKAAHYTRTNARGQVSRFRLRIGEDGTWVAQSEIQKPDKTWLLVMEFRMRRGREK